MKKIIVLLLVLLISGCGKKASGTLIIENTSSHDVICGIGEDYKSYTVSIPQSQTKTIAWKQYILWYLDSPKNIISYQETNGKVVISDNKNIHSYTVINNIGNLTIIDNDQYILADDTSKYIKERTIPKGETTINVFKVLQTSDIVFNKGTSITINGKQYDTFQKIGDIWYYNMNNNGVLETKKVNMDITNDYIVIGKIE